MSLTYNTILSQTQSEFNRTDTDFLNALPDFINRAQDRINADLKNILLEQYLTNTFTIGNPVIPKPAGWRRNITFNYGAGVANNNRTPIRIRSYEYLQLYWPDRTQTSPPLYYADYGLEHFLIAPTPDQAYPYEIAYMGLPKTLNPINQTNFVTNYAPSLILYAVFIEAATWLKNFETIPVFEEKYQKFLQPLIMQDSLRVIDRQTERSAD